MPPLDVEETANLNLWEAFHKAAPSSQTVHRLQLAQAWGIVEGGHILELGCGQGDCTTVLATIVGETGHVTGVDPASLDYGSPWTLGQAQAHLKQSKVGNRITFTQANPIDFLAVPENQTKFDTAVLAHCIYYMSSPTTLLNTFRALHVNAPSIKRLCIAEYALSASVPEAYAHVLAVLMQAALEVHKDGEKSESNIRTVVGPGEITRIANEAGWVVNHEGVLTPGSGLEDGHWEAGMALDWSSQKISELISKERERAAVGAMRESVARAVDGLGGVKKVRTMDVWWCVLTRA